MYGHTRPILILPPLALSSQFGTRSCVLGGNIASPISRALSSRRRDVKAVGLGPCQSGASPHGAALTGICPVQWCLFVRPRLDAAVTLRPREKQSADTLP